MATGTATDGERAQAADEGAAGVGRGVGDRDRGRGDGPSHPPSQGQVGVTDKTS